MNNNFLPYQLKKNAEQNSVLATQMAQNASDLMNYINAKINSPTAQIRNYHLFDSFTRADSTTSLGNAETNNTAWTTSTVSGNTVTWGIQSNSAYVVSRVNGTGWGIAYQETNEPDCILEVDISGTSGSGGGGIAFRVTDVNNFFHVSHNGASGIKLNKVSGGTLTTVAGSYTGSYTDGKLSVLLKGNRIEVYLDGFLLIRYYDSFNATATLHGLYSTGGSPYRWKNFSVKVLGIVSRYVNETFDAPLSKWYWSIQSANMSYSQTFNTSIKESGNSSLRIELHSDDPDVAGSRRCEILLPNESPLEERWYGFSLYLPNGGDEDYAYDTSGEILAQWHAPLDSGETSYNPPLALLTQAGRYQIQQHWDAGRITTFSTESYYMQDLGDYTADKGKWVQWVFHVKWGYLDAHEPLTEVYKNGILVYSRKGPNFYNNLGGAYQKLGIYKFDWHGGQPSLLTKRVAYYDNYWMK